MTESSSGRSGKTVLGLIIGIPMLVLGASYLMYYLAASGTVDTETVNRGTLIDPPVQLAEIDPVDARGEPFSFDRPDSQWHFLVVGDRHCDEACERMLYLTRQTHTALGKNRNRVGRLYLNIDDSKSEAFQRLVETEHRDMKTIHAEAGDWRSLLADKDIDPLAARQFFVVDPRGWVMMVYTMDSLEQEAITSLGKDVLKDMDRLLR